MKLNLRLCGCMALCAGLANPILASDRVPDLARQGEQRAHPTAAQAGNSFGLKVIAEASETSTMGFPFPAQIAEVHVRGGQFVRKGDLLIRGRDEELRAQRDLQQLSAETELPVERARAAMEQARVEFEGQEEIRRRSRATNLPYATIELDRARTTFILRQAEYELSKLEQQQQQLQLKLRQEQLDRMSLRAPFDGVIDIVHANPGEVRRDGEPVLRIVATDPLWLDVHPPVHQTLELALAPGDPAWIIMDLPGEANVYLGEVIEVAPTVDSASGTRRVRVELGNPEGWPSGLNAWVRFTEPSAEWQARIVEPREQPDIRETADLRPIAPKPAGASE